MTDPAPHPIQPLQRDEDGVLRFRANAIVRYVLNWGRAHGHGLNEIATMEFSKEDWRQFAQLIGYSLDGYGDLSYVDEAAYEEARKMAEKTPDQLDRLQRWQTDAARTLVALRRHATGQETLDGDCLSHWLDRADALTERRVLNEGADWRRL